MPAAEEGFERAFFVCAGRVVAARTLLPGGAGRLELDAGLAAAARAEASSAPEDADELLLIGSVPAQAAAGAARRAARSASPRRVTPETVRRSV